MSQQLPDVQSTEPTVGIELDRVGITQVEKLVKVARANKRPLVFTAEFEVFVDLPGWRKGADMSRNMEVIDEVLEDILQEPAHNVESICAEAASRLYEKHDYTSAVSVEMEAEYISKRETPASDRPTQRTVEIEAGATKAADELTERIGVTVTGMTVCPCSQEMSTQRARERLNELGVDESAIEEFLDTVPQPGHSQRGHASVQLEGPSPLELDFRNLIRIAEESMSAKIYNMAKRPDEDHMTYEAHADAKFVEDCVRAMARGVVNHYPTLPENIIVTLKQSNDESIHQHNAHAERRACLGDLRRELDEC